MDLIYQHEAEHYGLFPLEYAQWNFLKSKAKDCSLTDAALDKAIEELIEFEEKHDLTEVQK